MKTDWLDIIKVLLPLFTTILIIILSFIKKRVKPNKMLNKILEYTIEAEKLFKESGLGLKKEQYVIEKLLKEYQQLGLRINVDEIKMYITEIIKTLNLLKGVEKDNERK